MHHERVTTQQHPIYGVVRRWQEDHLAPLIVQQIACETMFRRQALRVLSVGERRHGHGSAWAPDLDARRIAGRRRGARYIAALARRYGVRHQRDADIIAWRANGETYASIARDRFGLTIERIRQLWRRGAEHVIAARLRDIDTRDVERWTRTVPTLAAGFAAFADL